MSAVPSFELDLPDLAVHRGDGPVPYAHRLTAPDGVPGPHALIAAIVHGNEPCGAILLDRMRPARGTLTLLFANPGAYARFDPAAPFASRAEVEDMNRLWSPAILDAPVRSPDHRRAKTLRALVATADTLLDLHSTPTDGPPLILTGLAAKNQTLAETLATGFDIVRDAGHAEGVRLRDYGPFADPDDPRTALLVECGQHWHRRTVATAAAVTARFLACHGMLPVGDATLPDPGPSEIPSRLLRVTDAITAESPSFHFLDDYQGQERIPAAGTAIARDGDRTITTPYDDCILVMPTPNARPGQTALRFAREEAA